MDIKETKEALSGLLTLAEIIGKELKDGAQLQDAVAIFHAISSDPAKKAELEAAFADIKKVPDEIKDISLSEGVELSSILIKRLPDLLKVLGK